MQVWASTQDQSQITSRKLKWSSVLGLDIGPGSNDPSNDALNGNATLAATEEVNSYIKVSKWDSNLKWLLTFTYRQAATIDIHYNRNNFPLIMILYIYISKNILKLI